MHGTTKRYAVPSEAAHDLAGNIAGRFSPEDWDQILSRAESKYIEFGRSQGASQAWQEVVRDFHRNGYWGFVPNYMPTAQPKKSIGVQFILFTVISFTITIIAVVWLGQIKTASDDPVDTYIFYAVIVLVLLNFGGFLWRYRNAGDESRETTENPQS